MPSFAIALPSKLNRPEGILMLVEDRQIAEEVAAEMRRRGRPVVVQEVRPPLTTSPDPLGH